MKTVKQYLEETYVPNDPYLVRKCIICNDGFSISVQGGTRGHYCEPRMHCNLYYKVECGYPSEVENLLLEYADNPNNPTNSIYAGVPIDVIEKVIIKHGGIK